MTEAEWLACSYPHDMLTVLQGKASDRKLRLFAVACCRRIWSLLPNEQGRQVIEVAERYADEQASTNELLQAQGELDDAEWPPPNCSLGVVALHYVRGAVEQCARDRDQYGPAAGVECAAGAAEKTSYAVTASGSPGEGATEFALQCKLLQDIFGSLPFSAPTIDPAWLRWNNATIPQLAQVIYDERELPSGHLDTGKLAILGDALIEAGCTNEDILGHCRSPGPHVRGCWVVDLILEKS